MRSAAKTTVSVFGVIVSIAGFEHGVGAVLQGNSAPGGVVFESWPDAPAYEILSGEPAMTVVPNLLVSGVLTVLVSVAFAVWSVRFVGIRRGGVGLIVLSVILLLVGGGFGPPILGFVIGLAATRLESGWSWLEHNASETTRRRLGALWIPSLAVGVAGYVGLWPGVPLLAYSFGIAEAGLVIALTILGFVGLFSSLLTAFARDSAHRSKHRS
ncbi:hypothetical protein SAMN05216559_1657 [Halomicrobium zhouii]|uniref:Uncharacterized protein n=1 Tax=Halomicrobium zhouii TaxID=767519 RepID=A0A1I6KZF9_9EURY|nr:hypothetical protein [Halomicrobium zhouii]SFR96605.1 hypothetical protein SAMN05216559_1657 [Halomicrobium zhouii]